MDRWVMDKWMKEWIKRRVHGWTQINEWKERYMSEHPARCVSWRMGEQMDG